MNPTRQRLRDRYVRSFTEKRKRVEDGAAGLNGDASSESETEVRRLCHQIAGSGGMYGFPELSAAAREAELSSLEGLPDALARLARNLSELQSAHTETFAEDGSRVPPPPNSQAGPLIFLADDDDDVRDSMQRAIEAAGFTVQSFHHGQELMAELPGRRIAAFVLDWDMPVQDGLETIVALRAGAAHRGTPIIMVTSKPASEHALSVMMKGADAYLQKPITPVELVAKLRELLAVAG